MKRYLRDSNVAARLAPALLGCCLVGTATAESPPPLSIGHRLVAEYVGSEQAHGTIVVSLTNRADQPLRGVMLRLAEPSAGQLTGAVNETFDLAPHETRSVGGRFQLDPAALAPQHGLEWQVLYRDANGYALQATIESVARTHPAFAQAEAAAQGYRQD